MAALLATAGDASAAALELHRVGESVFVVAPGVELWPAPFRPCASARELDAAWEDGSIAAVAALPDWLEADEFARVVLLVADPARLSAWETELLTLLAARGLPTAEVLPLAAGAALGQSWTSGRRLSSAP